MFKTIFAVAKQEFKSLLKNWITIIAVISFIIAPILVYSPITDGRVWNKVYAAYYCNNGLVSIAIMIMSFITISIYYKDEVTEMPILIFSQPIKGKTYAIGKFLGGYVYCLLFALLGNIAWMFSPIYFKEIPYPLLPFLKYFMIYSVPSFFAILSLNYFFQVLFNLKPLTIFLPMFMFMFTSGPPIPISYFGIMIDSRYTTNLYSGMPLPPEAIKYIMINRTIIVALAVLLLIISILKFSPKKLMDRR
ncbi:membrane protein [Clostridium lundense]|uniref:membrane protein n=1 Tax=Clostridium lundense TaxID=319475 RepID=UPI000481AE1D|nr:membrane protein [Clostridium lundense]